MNLQIRKSSMLRYGDPASRRRRGPDLKFEESRKRLACHDGLSARSCQIAPNAAAWRAEALLGMRQKKRRRRIVESGGASLVDAYFRRPPTALPAAFATAPTAP